VSLSAQQATTTKGGPEKASRAAACQAAAGRADFACMDPEAVNFPAPAIPVLPYLTLAQLSLHPRRPLPLFLQRPHAFFRNGRSALASVLLRERLQGRRVLLPGYMCKSVIEPIIWSRSTPLYFALDDALNVDLDDFERQLHGADAAIVTHFFGIPQADMPRIADLCRKHDVLLIEDCAHAFLGESAGRSLGSFGDYAIASTVKFCPGIEGGLLIANGRSLEHEMHPGWRSVRLRSALTLLDRGVAGYRSRRRRQAFSDQAVPPAPAWRAERLEAIEVVPDASGRYEWFDPNDVATPGDGCSYKLLYLLDYEHIARTRRENFARYLRAFADVPGCAPIIETLQAATVPYMFPLFVEDIERVFRTFKFERIPIWRWEQQPVDVPAIGQRYGRNLLHLPCHQCLRAEDIDAIAAEISALVTGAAR